jgi:hypothetical protein
LFFKSIIKTYGVVGVGGVVFSPLDNIRLTFSFVMQLTIKQRRMLSFKDCFQPWQHGVDSISILGNSKVVINHVRRKTLSSDMKLRVVFLRIRQEFKAFHTLAPYHILCHNNVTMDGQTNLAIRDTIGTLCINGQASFHHIP